MNHKQYELSINQIDVIVTNELKEAIDLNWNSDHEIVTAALQLLRYYLPAEDYQQYVIHLEINPPNDEPYENYN